MKPVLLNRFIYGTGLPVKLKSFNEKLLNGIKSRLPENIIKKILVSLEQAK